MAFSNVPVGVCRARDVHRAKKRTRRIMHVGFVATESPYGDRSSCGIAAYLRAMIPALLDAGHRVTLFANSKENRTFLAEDGRVSVYHFRLPSMHWNAAKVPGLRRLVPLPFRQLDWSI